MRYGFNEYADTVKVDNVAYNVCQITEPTTIEEVLQVNKQQNGKQQQILSTSR